MRKSAEIVRYGDRLRGMGEFDDESDFPIVFDPDTGEGWLSPFIAGVNTNSHPENASSHHRAAADRFGDVISEWDSNSISSDKEALKKYVERYARAMEKYREEHGKYPRQRMIGHSRGGGGAIELMRAINEAHPELPQVDEFIGLDPYDYPGAKTDPPKRKDNRLLARKSVFVRPLERSFFAEGEDSVLGNIRGALANLLVEPATPVNPLSKVRSTSVAIPNAHHTSVEELLEAAMVARKARNRKELRKLMHDYNRLVRIESSKSPDFDDHGSGQIYEKKASQDMDRKDLERIVKRANARALLSKRASTKDWIAKNIPAPLIAGGLTGAAVLGLQAAGYPGNKSNLDAMMDITDANAEEREAVLARNRRNYIKSAILAALAVGGASAAGKAIMG